MWLLLLDGGGSSKHITYKYTIIITAATDCRFDRPTRSSRYYERIKWQRDMIFLIFSVPVSVISWFFRGDYGKIAAFYKTLLMETNGGGGGASAWGRKQDKSKITTRRLNVTRNEPSSTSASHEDTEHRHVWHLCRPPVTVFVVRRKWRQQ